MRVEYKKLLTEYPDAVSKEELCRMCHISKRKAAWLLENGLIPCSDTGKKTRRFSIEMKDVVFYLKDREKHPEHYITPKGIFTRGNMCKGVSSEQQITRDNYKDFVHFAANNIMFSAFELPQIDVSNNLGILGFDIDRVKKSNVFPYGLTEDKISRLKGAGYNTVGQPAECTKKELQEIHGIGERTITKIKNVIDQAIWM